MNKVYIVFVLNSRYSDVEIIGVFDNLSKAEEIAKECEELIPSYSSKYVEIIGYDVQS